MKTRLLSILLLIVVTISTMNFAACKGETKTELTKENANEFLSFSCEILNYEIIKNRGTLYGVPVVDYSDSYGKARLVINKKADNLSFEDLKVRVKLSLDAGHPYPWEFKSGNKFEKNTYGRYDNCKYIDCVIPYDGEYSFDLDLVIGYNANSNSVLETGDLTHISIEIVSIEGIVTEK